MMLAFPDFSDFCTIEAEYYNCVGGGERVGAGHPLHLQRVAGLSHLLAHLRHHGGPALCRQILQGIPTEACRLLYLDQS